MIDAFGEQYNYEILRYKDEKSKFQEELYGQTEMLGEDEIEDKYKKMYPDDLENLVYFIRSLKKAAK